MTFRFIEGDSLASVEVTFRGDDGAAVDLSPYVPLIRYRVPGTSSAVEADMAVKNPPGLDGIASYLFPASALVAGELAGEYLLTDNADGRITSRREFRATVRQRIK